MHTMLCKVCQITGVLCPICQKKLEKGEISNLDVKVSVFLGRRTRNLKELNDVHLLKTEVVDGFLVLLFRKGDSCKFVKYGREIIREMREKFRMKVIALDYHPNLKQFIEEVFHPIPVATINIIWLPDGSKETRVIIQGRGRSRRIDLARRIIQKVKGIKVEVVTI